MKRSQYDILLGNLILYYDFFKGLFILKRENWDIFRPDLAIIILDLQTNGKTP